MNELKNYLEVRGLKISGNKNELMLVFFSARENNVKPVKTAVEVEEDLKNNMGRNWKYMIDLLLTLL